MADASAAVLEAINSVEEAARDLKTAIESHRDAAMKAKLSPDLAKLQAVIANLKAAPR